MTRLRHRLALALLHLADRLLRGYQDHKWWREHDHYHDASDAGCCSFCGVRITS